VRNRRRRFAEAGLPDDSSYARRCRQYGGRYEFIDKLAVFARDNWVCQLCGKPVDRDAQWPDPYSVSLDHRVPLSKGGDHLYENVQCSHLRCNQSKQHRG
jgi:5-methylcytosine-specific restriction endonuclease McrA